MVGGGGSGDRGWGSRFYPRTKVGARRTVVGVPSLIWVFLTGGRGWAGNVSQA